MKIISYKKIKQNKYEVTLSNNESVLLYDDIILKYELLTKKEKGQLCYSSCLF